MRCRCGFLVALSLAAYWAMAVGVSPRIGVTGDEVVHVTGGYTYWKFNDYRMHPENGTLPMRLAALPWLGPETRHPPLTESSWLDSRVNVYGDDLFFKCGNPFDRLLGWSRMVVALTGVFTAWLTWRWARGLFGPAAGWIALGLAVFCPTMLAHGGLATSDMTMTACVLAALSAVWRLLHRATWLRLLGAILACGLAFLSKMSGVLIVPLIGGLLVARWLRRAPLVLAFGRNERWLRHPAAVAGVTFGLMVAVGAGSLGVLWAGYGFRYAGFNTHVSPARDYYVSWDAILDRAPLPWSDASGLDQLLPAPRPLQPTALTKLIGGLREHRLLPEAYLWGFAHTYKFSRYRPAFFLGDYCATGWRTFFPVAFVFKTTLPALLLIAAGGGALLWAARAGRGRRFRPWLYRAAPLALFFVTYWAMAINMDLNIGHRHILPTYPVFYVLAAAAAGWLAIGRRRLVGAALMAVVAAHAGTSLLARPFYLAYFQPLVGGTAQGYRYFVDSSYDWGQGLPDLARWLDEQRRRGDRARVFLTYFGADSPRARGLEVVRFGDEISDYGERFFPAQVRGGWFIISATHLRRIYHPVRGPWTAAHETVYRELLARLGAAQAGGSAPDAATRARLAKEARDFENLQFGRLSYFLEHRAPDAIIGASLLAYRVADADVAFALYAPREALESRVAAQRRAAK